MDDTQLTTMLESLDSIGIVTVTRSGECSDFSITVSFDSLPGDQPQLEVRLCNGISRCGIKIFVLSNMKIAEKMCLFTENFLYILL
jgi:hypothetical protein